MLISWLIAAGLSEARSVTIGTWLRRNAATIAFCIGVMCAALYLVHKGGEWREQEIRQQWAAKFQDITRMSDELQSERAAMNAEIEQRVKDAIASLPKPAAQLPQMLQPSAVTVDCSIPIDAIRKYNRIK